jgi:hypothetical protein
VGVGVSAANACAPASAAATPRKIGLRFISTPRADAQQMLFAEDRPRNCGPTSYVTDRDGGRTKWPGEGRTGFAARGA